MKAVLALSLGIVVAEANAKSDPVREAVERALPYLEEEGTWWIEEKKCASCHHSTYFVWAKDLALKAGFEVDAGTLDAQRKWVLESLLEEVKADPEKPDAKVEPGTLVGDRNVEGVSQLLVSASSHAVPGPVVEKLREVIARNRDGTGNWKPGGQLPQQKRPAAETQWVSNQWALLAVGEEREGGVDSQVGPADGDGAKTSEWFAMDVVLLPEAKSISALLKRQNGDGGWSWIDGEPSSPTGTGQALFALARAKAIAGHPEAVERARAYLVATQSEDGHWETKSTKNRGRSTRISDFWGSAWAVIGLLESRE